MRHPAGDHRSGGVHGQRHLRLLGQETPRLPRPTRTREAGAVADCGMACGPPLPSPPRTGRPHRPRTSTTPSCIETVKGGGAFGPAHPRNHGPSARRAIAPSYESGAQAACIRGRTSRRPSAATRRREVRIRHRRRPDPEEAAVIRGRWPTGSWRARAASGRSRGGSAAPPSKGKSALNVWHESTVGSILCFSCQDFGAARLRTGIEG